jgi:hypothetical protein
MCSHLPFNEAKKALLEERTIKQNNTLLRIAILNITRSHSFYLGKMFNVGNSIADISSFIDFGIFLRHGEYIVYDASQVRMRCLVHVRSK